MKSMQWCWGKSCLAMVNSSSNQLPCELKRKGRIGSYLSHLLGQLGPLEVKGGSVLLVSS